MSIDIIALQELVIEHHYDFVICLSHHSSSHTKGNILSHHTLHAHYSVAHSVVIHISLIEGQRPEGKLLLEKVRRIKVLNISASELDLSV